MISTDDPQHHTMIRLLTVYKCTVRFREVARLVQKWYQIEVFVVLCFPRQFVQIPWVGNRIVCVHRCVRKTHPLAVVKYHFCLYYVVDWK